MRTVRVEWNGQTHYEGVGTNGIRIPMVAPQALGGAGDAASPKDLFVLGLAGCTAWDVGNMLGKSRLPLERLAVEVQAEEEAESPRVFTRMVVTYRVWGDIPPDRFRRAVELSWTKYCGVSLTLKPMVQLSYRLELNGELLPGLPEGNRA